MVKVDKTPIIVKNTYKLELGQEEYDIILGSLGTTTSGDIINYCEAMGYTTSERLQMKFLHKILEDSR